MLLSLGALAFTAVEGGIRAADLAEEVRTLDIEVVALVKVCLRRGLEILQEHDTSTRNQNVDFAEFVHSFGNHTLNVRDAAGITLNE